MAEDVSLILADYLTRHYARLRSRVTRMLGNVDLADDALQDTWLRVNSAVPAAGPIYSPTGYLLRMAVNIAVDIQRRDGRSLSLDEVDALIELADPAPGPEQVADGRARVAALIEHIDQLPKRQRQIVLLVHWEGMEQKDVAQRLQVSLRTVESDLKKAHDYLIARKNR